MFFSAIYILFFLLCHSTSQLSPYLENNSCTFTLAGHDFDLNPARSSSDYTGNDNAFTYILNFCGPTVGELACKSRNGTCCRYKEGAIDAMVTKFSNSTPLVQLLDNNKPTDGIQIKYNNGDLCYQEGSMSPRHSILSLTCAYTSDSSFRVTEDPECTHNIALRLRAACPLGFIPSTRRDLNISKGSIFLIFFTLLLIVYCCGGFIYNSEQKGKCDMESIPNIDIWREVSGLTKDGCRWTWMMIKTRGKRGHLYGSI